jgi:hypothetical protein
MIIWSWAQTIILILSVGVNCLFLLTWIPPGRFVREMHRVAYRRGLSAGYRRYEKEWHKNRRIELLAARRNSEPRENAVGTARVSQVKYGSRR